ncbi:hypothetical protein E4U39_006429, partial [Claviceps sp. Clav50 group G5]
FMIMITYLRALYTIEGINAAINANLGLEEASSHLQDASGWIYATQIPPDYEGDIDEYITKRLEEQRALLEASQDIMQSLSDVE